MNRQETKGFDAAIAGDGSELEKITAGFDYVTRLIIQQAQNEIELLRAEGNREALVKEQIKMNTIIHTRYILNRCCQRVTGKEVYDELAE